MPGQGAIPPRIVVELHASCARKLTEKIERTDSDVGSLADVAQAVDEPKLAAVLAKYGSPPSRPLISHHTVKDQVKRRGTRILYDFFAIETQQYNEAQRKALCDALRDLHEIVESAEFEPTFRLAKGGKQKTPAAPKSPKAHKAKLPKGVKATVHTTTLAQWEDAQFYLKAVGFSDHITWYGHDIGFADIEHGWNLDHDCFRDSATGKPIQPLHQSPGPYHGEAHGTAALSIVLGNPNSGRIRGIAFRAKLKALITPTEDVWQTIYKLVEEQVLGYGDVLLIEIEWGAGPFEGLPLEVFPAAFRVIQFAVSHGVVVVEPAGNGFVDANGRHGWNLDALNDEQSRAWRSPDGSPRDSGAIMVSACEALPNAQGAYVPLSGCNYGSRVDCYAPGYAVLAASTHDKHNLVGYTGLTGDLGGTSDNDSYDGYFNNTSAASAIIAGVLLVTQSVAREFIKQIAPQSFIWPLSPQQIRRVLRDPCECMGAAVTRHPEAGAGADPEGVVVPNIARIAQRIPSLPQIRIRADLDEDGAANVPRAFDATAESPDIIVRSSEVPDVAGQFGAGSPFELLMPPNDALAPGKEAYLYFRLRNQGDGNASNVRASVYWSRHDGPDKKVRWQLLGEKKGIDVPMYQFVVTPPLVWRVPPDLSSEVKRVDLLVIVGDDKWDPRPELPLLKNARETLRSRADLLEFMLANRSVAWRMIQLA